MGWFDGWFADTGGGGTQLPVFPVLTSATTADAIRDRAIAVIQTLIPTYLPSDLFRPYLNERDGNFEDWAAKNSAGSLRRYQVRFDGSEDLPEISNTDIEERHITLTITVAYPQNARTGNKQALDRDTAIDRDKDLLELNVGILGRYNFTNPYPDASCRGWHATRDSRGSVDFLVIRAEYWFYRQLR